MNGFTKEAIAPATCKNHNSRSDREFRICPSKLSKRELEDLYFTLLENNLDLKKTVNIQQEKIKVLSTKVQRMTAVQKNSLAKEPKDCCAHTKTIVNEHKESISTLKNENERMLERIRILNMRLCSAKQFARRSSAYQRCSSVAGKNSLMSVINTKTSNNNLRSATVSSQCFDKDFPTSSKSVDIVIEGNVEAKHEKSCSENKCRTLMEELKQKIADLQVELSKTHQDYTGRISHLESEVAELHNDNHRLRSECAASEYGLQQGEQRANELTRCLRTTEAQYGELAAQLSIERRKVAELETHVKAADMSRSVARTIEDHLSNVTGVKSEIIRQPSETVSSIPNFSVMCDKSMTELKVPFRSRKSDASTDMNDQKVSDDSGYVDANKSQDEEHEKAMGKLNEELMERINDLQEQLTVLKMSANVGVDNTKIVMTSKRQEKLDMNKSAASASRVARAHLDESPLDSSDTDIHAAEMIDIEQKQTDIKKLQEANDDLEMDISKRTLSPLKRDSHNSYQIPGPLPVDVETRKAIRQSEKIAASKFKQLIDANSNKKKKQKIRRELQTEIKINDDQMIPNKDVNKVENMNASSDDLDKVSTNFYNKCTNIDEIENDDARRKSVEDKLILHSERSIKNVRSPLSSAPNITKDEATPVVEDELVNNGPQFGTQTETIQPTDHSVKPAPEASLGRRSETYNKGGTYSVPRQCERATSPDNTDHEISSLTDLPSEKDDKPPRALSPGEEKGTTTYTDSYTAPTTDYGSLSEGELPATGRDQQSLGETKVNFANVPSLTSQRMEEALQAISEELARCRELMMSQRTPEVNHHLIRR